MCIQAQVAQQTTTTIRKRKAFSPLFTNHCVWIILEINFSLIFSTTILTSSGFVSEAKQAAHAHFLRPQGLAFPRLLG